MKVLLVGCGKMGSALLLRWLERDLPDDCWIVEPGPVEIPGLKNHVSKLSDVPAEFQPEVVVFAVKPQILGDITKDYKAYADKGALMLSIAAGKPVAFFEQHLGAGAKIVRAMPNTPAAIGQGMTVAYANARNTAADKASAKKLLSAVGDFMWVDEEKLLNPVTALSGSGPAYLFLLIEAMTKAGVKAGLSPSVAEKLARQTVIGSASLAKQSPDLSAATLRENVTSPGGTTAAALNILMADGGMQDLFDRAIDAATKRAEELSK